MLMDDINSTDAMEFSIEASGVKGLKRAPFAAGARRERGAPIPASPGAASSASRAASGLSNASTHSRLAAPGTGAPRGGVLAGLQPATEPPAGVVRFGAVVIDEDTTKAPVAKDGAAEFPDIRRSGQPA